MNGNRFIAAWKPLTLTKKMMARTLSQVFSLKNLSEAHSGYNIPYGVSEATFAAEIVSYNH